MNTVLTTRVYMNLVWLARGPVEVTGVFTSATIGQPNRPYGTIGAGSSMEMHTPVLARERMEAISRHRSLLAARD